MKFTREPLLAFSAILAIAFAQAACATAQRSTESSAYASFGVDLYKELLREKPEANIFISSASVGFALAMTMNGAADGTRDAMANVLRLSGIGIEAVSTADSTLINRMNDTIRAVKLSVANSLWARRDVTFKKDFLQRNKRYYGADIRVLDFSNPGAPATINNWVAEKTNDKIAKIVDAIDPSTILFLINAIYFKGTWSKEFDKTLTREAPFRLMDGSTSPRPMMRQSGKYDYLDGEGFQAVRLPYGDGRIGMYVFLPADSSSLERFHEGLTGEELNAWIGNLAPRSGTVGLPRFRLEYEAVLNQSLSALGMTVAFDAERANFTKMFDAAGANAYIHEVRHKTFVEVNEEGTEAAAVTSVEMRVTSVMEEEPPFEMIVDRPFFLAIVDRETGLILFMGAIVNP
ncbi:MAG: serpin family protein [Candidatus Krumholzibacteriia bacterium]